MQPFRPWFDQVWLRSKIARNPLRFCMHGYLSNGYLNSLSNFNYEKVEKIWSLRPLLDQPWIMTKIAPNIVKVGIHSYLPNAQINLWKNFNYEKLVKSETPLCCFPKVGLKAGENNSQHHESSCARLSIKWTSKSMSKLQLWETAQKWNSVLQFHYGWA